ncbi:MAG: hypothetical protein HZA50_03820 [Planctomycetes bacterium]|nr:hypothetical protein [Planctomycetota bacterium]
MDYYYVMLLVSDIWNSPWIIIPLAAIYVWTCFRIGLTASQYGRRLWVWFLISLCFTAIPAAIFLWIDYFRLRRRQQLEEDEDDEQVEESAGQLPAATATPAVSTAPAVRAVQPETEPEESSGPLPMHAIVCPNCHGILQPGQTARIGGILKCLKCGLPIDEIKLA